MGEIIITSENFEKEVKNSETPVLLDFWANWCGPCRLIAPTITEIAEEYAGKIKVGKINVDEQPKLAGTFRVSGIPTIIIIKDGKVVNSIVGARPKEQIIELLAL